VRWFNNSNDSESQISCKY